jgi:hypothetical protein
VAVEVASESDQSTRELDEKLAKYRRSGVGEVVWFDPLDELRPLRLWDHIDGDLDERDLSDPEGRRCDALEAYWIVVKHPELGPTLRLARERDGANPWPTAEEAERAEKEAERAEKQNCSRANRRARTGARAAALNFSVREQVARSCRVAKKRRRTRHVSASPSW